MKQRSAFLAECRFVTWEESSACIPKSLIVPIWTAIAFPGTKSKSIGPVNVRARRQIRRRTTPLRWYLRLAFAERQRVRLERPAVARAAKRTLTIAKGKVTAHLKSCSRFPSKGRRRSWVPLVAFKTIYLRSVLLFMAGTRPGRCHAPSRRRWNAADILSICERRAETPVHIAERQPSRVLLTSHLFPLCRLPARAGLPAC